MEHVDGRPLTTWCDERRWVWPQPLQLLLEVLAAVQFAHANLIIHRDLKPSNILVTADGVRLLDFGIAKLLAADDRAQRPHPRRAGRRADPGLRQPRADPAASRYHASDVYSLGVVLFELLTGTRPYQLKVHSVAQLEEAIVSAEPLQPSWTVTTESAAARDVSKGRLTRQLGVPASWTPSCSRRWASPPPVATRRSPRWPRIPRHLRHEPVVARPPSTSYRVRKASSPPSARGGGGGDTGGPPHRLRRQHGVPGPTHRQGARLGQRRGGGGAAGLRLSHLDVPAGRPQRGPGQQHHRARGARPCRTRGPDRARPAAGATGADDRNAG